MIYKFKVWSWKPMTTEIYLSALTDEKAVTTFNALNKDNFSWKTNEMLSERSTYEIIKDEKMEPREDTTDTTKPDS